MSVFFKYLSIIVLMVTSTCTVAQSFEEWEKESRTNHRLLPRYGFLRNSAEHAKVDSDYVKEIMALPQFKNRREASNHLIRLGFNYYYRPDLKTAMYRFNQAYLLDTTNTDIYWGYGAVYMALGKFDLAMEQYEIGLSMDPGNTHILTDIGTFYMTNFYEFMNMPAGIIADPKKQAMIHLDSALSYMNRSYALDQKDVNTAFKLSVAYWAKGDCDNAWKFYDIAMDLGGAPVTEAYKTDLKRKCKR